MGPWWFISFIFQFYIVFPFLYKAFVQYGTKFLLWISISSTVITMVFSGDIGGVNVYYTIIGHFPELCLAMYLAQNHSSGPDIPWYAVGAVAVVFFMGNVYEIFWYVNHLAALILLLIVLCWLLPTISRHSSTERFFLFFGSLSMPLFLVNGFLRQPFFKWAENYGTWYTTIALCMLSLFTSIVVALVLQRSEIIARQAARKLFQN